MFSLSESFCFTLLPIYIVSLFVRQVYGFFFTLSRA